jgi:hypothetical protein
MENQELINLTDLKNFDDEFNKIEAYLDSYLYQHFPNKYETTTKNIVKLKKMLEKVEESESSLCETNPATATDKTKELVVMQLNKIKVLRSDIQKLLDESIERQGRILGFISVEYMKSNHKTDKYKFPTSMNMEQVAEDTFKGFVLHKIFKIDNEKSSLSEIDEAYEIVRNKVLPKIKDKLLTYMGNVINSIGRDGAKLFQKNYVKQQGFNKPKKETQENYEKIRKHYIKLENTGKYTAKYIRKTLADKYGLSEAYIRDIMYK